MNHRASSETGRSDADGISMTRSPSLSSSSSVKSYRHKWSARKQPLSTVRSSSNLPSPSPDSNLGSAEGFDVYGSDASVSYEGNPMANARAALVQLQDRVRSAYTSGMLTEPFDTDLIDELFELALEAEHGHLGDIQKDAMRKISPEGKLHVISSVASRQEPKHLTDGDKQPLYYIEFINQAAADTVHGKKRAQQLVGLVTRLSSGSGGKQPHLKDVLEELKVQCSCQSLSWVLNFLDLGGLPALFTLLHAMHRKHDSKLKHFEIESEILKILKIVVNQNRGITELLNNSRYLSIIVLSLDSPLLSARTSAADFLLALVTIEYPRGHKLVMGAFEHFRAAHDDLHTFQRLVSALDSLVQTRGVFGTTVGSRSENSLLHFGDKNREQTQRDIKDFLISTVTLLRLVVDVPPELEYRIHLRNELMASGFGKILKTLRTWASQEFAEILTHVDAFEYRAAADHQDFADDLESLTGIDLDDPNGLLEGLLGSFAEGDGGKDYVLSILQHLLIPARLIDGPSKAKVFRLLDLMVAQVVLDRNGLDPGFTDMYKISVEEVMEGISEEVAAENELLRAKVIFNEAVRKPCMSSVMKCGCQ
ncbi:armadillo-type protein [Powellomyces hirtus]|nr:armadillo-type protein [Powellomyces hirtus]